MAGGRPHVGFVLERVLGHDTHAGNLIRLLADEPAIDPSFFDVTWDLQGFPARVPGFNSNWTVRAGMRARRGIRAMQRARPLDALFVHTQVPAVLSPDWLARIPTVVSLDATPLQYDELGEHYDHQPGSSRVEELKWRLNRTCFARARHLVAWSEWAKHGIVDGYGIEPEKITVLAPGVVTSAWTPGPPKPEGAPVEILFVGGDLERKGGELLLRAFRELRDTRAGSNGQGSGDLRLHLVTRSEVAPEPGVSVHHGLGPTSPELLELYRQADVFCLPTKGDCLPMVLSEAGAAGLPLVSTSVAAIPEIVRDGETGFVVAPDDEAGLVSALRALVDSAAMRSDFGSAARRLVEHDFDAGRNAHRLVEILTAVARGDRVAS